MVVHIADLCFRGSEKFVDRLLLFLCSEGFRVPRAFSGSCVGVMAPLGCLRLGFLCVVHARCAQHPLPVVSVNKQLRVLLEFPM